MQAPGCEAIESGTAGLYDQVTSSSQVFTGKPQTHDASRPTLFDRNDGEQLSRLLLGAEIWAAQHPEAVAEILEELWRRRWDLDLGDRIQLWICMMTHSRVEGQVEGRETFMPRPSNEACDPLMKPIITKPRRLLEVLQEYRGAFALPTHSLLRGIGSTGLARSPSVTPKT